MTRPSDPWLTPAYHDEQARELFEQAMVGGTDGMDRDLLAVAQFHATIAVSKRLADLAHTSVLMESHLGWIVSGSSPYPR